MELGFEGKRALVTGAGKGEHKVLTLNNEPSTENVRQSQSGAVITRWHSTPKTATPCKACYLQL